jgi:hypothetical protein
MKKSIKILLVFLAFLITFILAFIFTLKTDISSIKKQASYIFEVYGENQKELSEEEKALLVERLSERIVEVEGIKGFELNYSQEGNLLLSKLNLFQILKVKKIIENTSENLEKTVFARNHIEFQLLNEDQSLTNTGLNGKYIKNVKIIKDTIARPYMYFYFDSEGTKLLEEITKNNARIWRPLVITVDGERRWAPLIEDPIYDGVMKVTIWQYLHPFDIPMYTTLSEARKYPPFLNMKVLPGKLKLISCPELNKLMLFSLIMGFFMVFISIFILIKNKEEF